MQDDTKLITTETGSQVSWTDAAREANGDDFEQLISDVMTVAIVDELEAVNVQKQDGRIFVFFDFIPEEDSVGVCQKLRTVRQASERIVLGFMHENGFGGFAS